MAENYVIDYIVKTDCQFVLRQIGEKHILVSVGSGLEHFNGYLTMNDTAIFLWNSMRDRMRPQELVQLLIDTYGIEEELAAKDVGDFLTVLLENHIIEGVIDDQSSKAE